MVALLTTPVLASGCQKELSTLHPAGAAAREIANLWWMLLAGAGVIFTLVMLLLAVALWRRRLTGDAAGAGEAGTDAEGGSEKVWVWGLGLAFPLATLSLLTVYGVVVGERLLPRDAPDLVTVQAEARQWQWSFAYADAPGRVTENLLHIPAGRPVDVEITSLDVIHAFWVPRLAGKLDAIPGHVNVLRLQADQPGDYAGVSGEFSGLGYREHLFTLRAHDPASWATFLEGQTP